MKSMERIDFQCKTARDVCGRPQNEGHRGPGDPKICIKYRKHGRYLFSSIIHFVDVYYILNAKSTFFSLLC